MTKINVLFDLDGTLIDSSEAIIDSYKYTFEEEGLGEFPNEYSTSPHLIMAARPAEIFGQVSGRDPSGLNATYGDRYISSAYRKCKLYENVLDTLKELSKSKVGIGIVTNKGLDRVEVDLEFLNLDQFEWSCIVTAEDTPQRKPDPAPIFVGLNQANFDAATTWYVGDGPQDVKAGKSAGLRTIGCAYGYYGMQRVRSFDPTAVVRDVTDIPAILGI